MKGETRLLFFLNIRRNPIAPFWDLFYLEKDEEGEGRIWNDVEYKGKEEETERWRNTCESYCLPAYLTCEHVQRQ